MVTEGDRVFWRQAGPHVHTVTADDGAFNSGQLAPGAYFATTFTAPGTYRYYCALHGGPNGTGMSGRVVVEPRRGRFHPVTPARLLDTHAGNRLGRNQTRAVPVTGGKGVPVAGVSAVVLNVTASEGANPGALTVYPRGGPVSSKAQLQFEAARAVANLVQVRPGSDGAVTVLNSGGAVHAVVDIVGYYDTSPAGAVGRFQPVEPRRLLDSRATTAFGPGETRALAVGAGVGAVVVNLTVHAPTASQRALTAWPAGEARPTLANLPFAGGQTVANRAVIAVPQSGAEAGRINLHNAAGSVHVIVDLVGSFSAVGTGAGAVSSIAPVRILDTHASSTARRRSGACRSGRRPSAACRRRRPPRSSTSPS